MAEMIPFKYRGFYDVPRFILIRHRGQALFLQSPFDDNLDEYPDVYSVYEVPDEIAASVLTGDWTILDTVPLHFVGEIPISTVAFDPTKRQTLDPACLEHLFAGS